MTAGAVSAVRVRPAEREVAAAEVLHVLQVARGEEYRLELADLAAALDEGELGPDEQATLEGVLEVALQTGRIRAVHGPQGEQAALKLYRRLPRGAELGESAAGVTAALQALVGSPLEAVSVQAVGPGAFTLSLAAGELEVSVRLDRQGSRLTSVGI